MNFIDKRNFKEDHFQSYIKLDPRTGKKKLKLLTPSMVVHIGSPDELKLQLDHYRKPLLRELVPNDPKARKNLVEHIRPALRYWCAKFGVEVPDWLQDEKQFVEMSPEDKKATFGTDTLVIKEFKKFKRPPLNMKGDQGGQDAQ